ncbi:N-formylglutamate amidohydrolase [Flexibacterium corallicola]|uniref:N-formylglutamate amidohydrolase n=1 Tax=Flexibacterium corallicola TaxID=3037259 RepID=UPI00286F51F9|nr:N-formylglutamate amidohydrolase [Pseudovibrio sp. M1P-2-3]
MQTIESYNQREGALTSCPAYEILRPATRTTPFIFNSPHSGRAYKRSFLENSRLDQDLIRYSEDAYVDEIIASYSDFGGSVLKVNFPRAYLDVNREPYELDPRIFSGKLPSYANARSPRVGAGLGTIARIVSENMEIYRHRLPVSEGLERIDKLYKPYHTALNTEISKARKMFGKAYLLDFHSMPSNRHAKNKTQNADIVLGDRFGGSCDSELTFLAMQFLQDKGFYVVRNTPYAGGFITDHYGKPSRGVHALQIEINRHLYMNEATKKVHDGFDDLAAALYEFTSSLITAVWGRPETLRDAAE